MKKIIMSTIFSILLVVGGIFFIKNKQDKNYLPQRNYIVVEGRGDVDYKFPLTFSKNIFAYQAASKFSLSFSKIYIQEKKKWVKIPYDFQITKDQKIKITK